MRRVLAAVVIWCALQGAGAASDAAALWNQGKREDAVAAWAAELVRRPSDVELRWTLVRAELALHRNAAAFEHLAPLGAEADAVRGTALFRMARYEEALHKLRADDVEQLVMRIDALEALARFDEAEAAVGALATLAGDGDPRVTTARGRGLARKRKFDEAAAQFRRSLERDPCDAAALFGLGQALVRAGKREEGLRVLEEHRRVTPLLDQLDFAKRSVDLAPLHAPNHAAVGDAERALGRLELAEKAYARASELARGDEVVPVALRRARLFAEDRRDVARAVELLDEAAARAPDARLFVRAGDLLASDRRVDEALQRYESARKLRPSDAEIERRIAQVRERKQ
jgi:tetratricopeptide (TPR) repeat protein